MRSRESGDVFIGCFTWTIHRRVALRNHKMARQADKIIDLIHARDANDPPFVSFEFFPQGSTKVSLICSRGSTA